MIKQLSASTYNNDLQKLGWKISTYNTTVVIEPPANQVNLHVLVDDQNRRASGYTLIWPTETRYIDVQTHRNLLEKSLDEYKNIWKTLAEK